MEIVKLNLENEMDLMLSYKRGMKMAELCGLSVLVQTSFATAVSEIARSVIRDKKEKSTLTFCIDVFRGNKKELVASIISNTNFEKDLPDALKYARRLTDDLRIIKTKDHVEVRFIQPIGLSGLITEAKMESFVSYFKSEAPISPYDEVRKKNIMLLEVSDKLRNSENRYRDLTRTLPLMIFTTNAIGNINYSNKWMLDFFKLSEIQPDKISWTSFVHVDDIKRIRDDWDKAMLAQGQLTTEAKLKAKDANDFVWHIISLTPVKNEDNQVISWSGFFVDIQSQKIVEETLVNNKQLKQAQNQLLKYQKNLEEKVFELNKSNHDLEQFAYIASHDLQEPLRKIRTFSSLVKKNLDNPEQALGYLEKVEHSSERMVSLIKDVLNYSRLIKSNNTFVDTDLDHTLKNVLLDMELVISDKHAIITSDKLPTINAVPQQLYQLFYNLLGNALKFNDGQPKVHIGCSIPPADKIKKMTDLHPNVKYVELVFKDNGIGFDEKYASQVFTIFKRLHSRESYSGTGIGLALCKKIIDNHHGKITVHSEVGKGTEFHVFLPVS